MVENIGGNSPEVLRRTEIATGRIVKTLYGPFLKRSSMWELRDMMADHIRRGPESVYDPVKIARAMSDIIVDQAERRVMDLRRQEEEV